MEPITIDQLYENYEILSEAKEKITEHEKEYKQILSAVQGDAKEKRLASQFIGKFFKFFPHLMDAAIDAQLDLCEDPDLQIRRQAIKDLPQLCKDSKEHTAKITDILSQLLVVQDLSELQQVHMSLITVAKLDAIEALTGLFSQILTGDEATRERCLKFLSTKFRNLGPEIITKEVEDHMITQIKKVLHDVTAEEFHTCMTLLGSTKLGKSVTGHAELVTLAVEQADLDTSIDADTNEDEVVERYIQCANHALPYFSSQIESTKFVKFMAEKILQPTTWNLIGVTEQQDQMQLRLLKVFAEMCTFCGALEKPAENVEVVFNVLQDFMPLPPVDADVEENPSFQFSHAECLLYALHTIGKQAPTFFAFADEPAKLKEFRSRLQYLARGTQGYIKRLQEAIRGKTPEELSTEENKIKVTALLTTSNISTLIRDLFHSPPTFKSVVHLSWVPKKPNTNTAAAVQKQDKAGNKRHAPITFTGRNGNAKNGAGGAADGAKRAKATTGSEQRVYSPPSGKYSAKVANYSNNGGGGNAKNGSAGNTNNQNRNRNQARRSGGSTAAGGNQKAGNNRRRR